MTRTVFLRGIDVEVARHVVRATEHFQLVAHSVAIGVVDAAIAVVELSWEDAIRVSFCCFVVVAGQGIVATRPRNWERQRHACSVERLLVDVTELDVDQRVSGARRCDLTKQHATVDGISLSIGSRHNEDRPSDECVDYKVTAIVPVCERSQCFIESTVQTIGITWRSSNGPPRVVFNAREARKKERVDLTTKVTAQGILVERSIAFETPRLRVGAIHGRHFHVVCGEIGIDAVRAFTRAEGVGRNHIVRKPCAKPSSEGARTVVFICKWVVVVCRRIGASWHWHLREDNGDALFVESVRVGVVPLEIQRQVDHAICGELSDQNSAVSTCFSIGTLTGKQKPRTSDERINGEPTSSFKSIEVLVHAHLLHVTGAIGILRPNREPAVVLQAWERCKKQGVDGLGQHSTHRILVE